MPTCQTCRHRVEKPLAKDAESTNEALQRARDQERFICDHPLRAYPMPTAICRGRRTETADNEVENGDPCGQEGALWEARDRSASRSPVVHGGHAEVEPPA